MRWRYFAIYFVSGLLVVLVYILCEAFIQLVLTMGR